jgi:hypothetical protein
VQDPTIRVADAIRKVTVQIQKAKSARPVTNADLVEALLAIADELDREHEEASDATSTPSQG